MNDLTQQTQALAKAKGLSFKDCGGGHIQVKNGKTVVNYYPEAKNRTIWRNFPKLRASNCSPHDVIQACLSAETVKHEGKELKAPRRQDSKPQRVLQTNPSGIKHLYSGELPPWDERLGSFISSYPDLLRVAAYRIKSELAAMEQRIAETDAPVVGDCQLSTQHAKLT